MEKGTEILRDGSGGKVEIPDAPKKVQVRGFGQDLALELFFKLIDDGYACSIKHLGGYYFVEVPVGLRGDPCFGKNAEIQTLAKRAGCQAIQTGNTLRIIG